ncbi:Transposable element Tc1 transposase [Anthophora quadrimaculata]
MEQKRVQTDISTRNLIIKLCLQGKSFREVGKIVGRTHSTVQKIINKFRYEGTVRNKPGRGRKKILTTAEERFICRKIKIDPQTNIRNLTSEVSSRIKTKISVETIRRTLRKEGYNGRIARKKPYISEANRKKRLEFAKAFVNYDESFWENVIFSDETKINLFGRDGRKQIVWRKVNTEYDKKNTCPTIKHGGGSVMLWGCIGSNGTGSVEFINGKMDKIQYLNILKKHLKQSAEKLKMPLSARQ